MNARRVEKTLQFRAKYKTSRTGNDNRCAEDFSGLIIEVHISNTRIAIEVNEYFRGEAAEAEHRALSTFALARDWRSAQTTIVTHIQDCVAQMLAGGLVE